MKKISTMNAFQIGGLYFKIKKYISADVSIPTVFNMAFLYKKYKQKPLTTIEGTNKVNQNTGWNEYHLKQSSLRKTILSLYYVKVK